MEMLQEIQKDLEKYSHVNVSASTAISEFTVKKREFENELKKLEEEKESIEDLKRVVEQEKSNSIYITFKQISLNFSETFEKLVPKGKAWINIKTQPSGSDSQSQIPNSATQNTQNFTDKYFFALLKSPKLGTGLYIFLIV